MNFNGMDYQQIAEWLCFNFSPDDYRAGGDVYRACNLSFHVYSPYESASFTVEFLNSLWSIYGELPEDSYHIDSYGRLTTITPNYAKPGRKERMIAEVDVIEPPNYGGASKHDSLFRIGQ